MSQESGQHHDKAGIFLKAGRKPRTRAILVLENRQLALNPGTQKENN
jgi:hypothetical protein